MEYEVEEKLTKKYFYFFITCTLEKRMFDDEYYSREFDELPPWNEPLVLPETTSDGSDIEGIDDADVVLDEIDKFLQEDTETDRKPYTWEEEMKAMQDARFKDECDWYSQLDSDPRVIAEQKCEYSKDHFAEKWDRGIEEQIRLEGPEQKSDFERWIETTASSKSYRGSDYLPYVDSVRDSRTYQTPRSTGYWDQIKDTKSSYWDNETDFWDNETDFWNSKGSNISHGYDTRSSTRSNMRSQVGSTSFSDFMGMEFESITTGTETINDESDELKDNWTIVCEFFKAIAPPKPAVSYTTPASYYRNTYSSTYTYTPPVQNTDDEESESVYFGSTINASHILKFLLDNNMDVPENKQGYHISQILRELKFWTSGSYADKDLMPYADVTEVTPELIYFLYDYSMEHNYTELKMACLAELLRMIDDSIDCHLAPICMLKEYTIECIYYIYFAQQVDVDVKVIVALLESIYTKENLTMHGLERRLKNIIFQEEYRAAVVKACLEEAYIKVFDKLMIFMSREPKRFSVVFKSQLFKRMDKSLRDTFRDGWKDVMRARKA